MTSAQATMHIASNLKARVFAAPNEDEYVRAVDAFANFCSQNGIDVLAVAS